MSSSIGVANRLYGSFILVVSKRRQEGKKLKKIKFWGNKTAISALAILSLTISVTPASAVDTSGDSRYAELSAAIAATKTAMSKATSFSFSEENNSTYSPKSAGKGSTLITVTPTISEYFSRTYQSVDKKKTWQLVGINSHVYRTNGKVYTEISDDHSWDAGYNSHMAAEIRKFSPFSATWVVSDATGPNQNGNAFDPVNTASSYIEGLDAVGSYIDVARKLPDLWITANDKGEKVYIVDFNPEFPKLIYTYTINPVTGFVTSFGFSSVTDGVKSSSTFRVSIGDAVAVPVLDPTSLNSIEQTEIIKKVRGLTAQDLLNQPAQLLVKIARLVAKKTKKPFSPSLVLDAALNTFGSANIQSVTGGVRLAGTYQGEVGYMCVLVKKSVATVKGCK